MVQHIGTSGTSSNNVSRRTRSKNVCKCYLDLRVHLKTGYYEETNVSKANTILHIAHCDGKWEFTIKNYYNLVVKEFFQLKEVGTIYMLTESKKINQFENGIKEPTTINFSITEKSDWNKLAANK